MHSVNLSAVSDSGVPGVDAVLAVDIAGRVIYVNRGAEAMTGQARDDLFGHLLADLFEAAEGAAQQGASGLARRAMGEDRRVGPAGDWVLDRRRLVAILVELHAEPIRGRDGRVTGAVIVFRDVVSQQAQLGVKHRYGAMPSSQDPTRSSVPARAAEIRDSRGTLMRWVVPG